MSFFNKNNIVLFVIIGVVIIGGIFLILINQNIPEKIDKPLEEEIAPKVEEEEANLIEKEAPKTTPGFKLYRNKEWGFEFEYPEWWILKESSFANYYSKFTIEMRTPTIFNNEERFDSAFIINIVLPEFIRGFDNLEKTISEIVVAGVPGVKYEYIFNDFPETAVILPFGELRMLLGTGVGSKQYLVEFNQILASFKFLNSPQ